MQLSYVKSSKSPSQSLKTNSTRLDYWQPITLHSVRLSHPFPLLPCLIHTVPYSNNSLFTSHTDSETEARMAESTQIQRLNVTEMFLPNIVSNNGTSRVS